MKAYESMVLENGLRVFLHSDPLTPLIAINLMYKVGAADEKPTLTGLAHFLEHMMFTGTKQFPNYDDPLQFAGGDSNAYTSADVTSYHAQLPAENLPFLLALEADRMRGLTLTESSFLTQKNVILEEFKEQYLMKPYGDLWPTVLSTRYQENHPYSWMPIGKDLEAIKNIELKDLQVFYNHYYNPSNACLAIAGNLSLSTMKEMVEHYFNEVETSKIYEKVKPNFKILQQSVAQSVTLHGKVAEPVILWTMEMPALFTKAYHIAEFWLHYLDAEESSPLYEYLVLEEELLTDVSAYHTESIHEGVFAVELRGIEEEAIESLGGLLQSKIEEIFTEGMSVTNHKSILNKIKTALLFEELSIENKAHNMAFYGLLEKTAYYENELKEYESITPEEINEWGKQIIKSFVANTFYYLPE